MNESMEIRDRIKMVREALGISQQDFGERIGVKRATVCNYEKKERNVSEQAVKSICREFGVDYAWLTTGDGEMFVESDDDIIETIDRIMIGENEFHKNLFKTFARLDEDELLALERIIDKFKEVSREKD